MHHAQSQIYKLGLECEKWFVACCLNVIHSSGSMVHDKAPQTFKEAILFQKRIATNNSQVEEDEITKHITLSIPSLKIRILNQFKNLTLNGYIKLFMMPLGRKRDVILPFHCKSAIF